MLFQRVLQMNHNWESHCFLIMCMTKIQKANGTSSSLKDCSVPMKFHRHLLNGYQEKWGWWWKKWRKHYIFPPSFRGEGGGHTKYMYQQLNKHFDIYICNTWVFSVFWWAFWTNIINNLHCLFTRKVKQTASIMTIICTV